MKTLRLVIAFAALSAVGASYRSYGAHGAYGTYDRAPAPSAFSAFADPELTSLLDRALAQNQDLAAAAARVDQARALAGAARADFFPQVAVDASAARQRNLDNNYRASDYANLPGVATWELDLWGRIRKSTKAARAEAGAAQATFEAARVSLSAEVAQTHYTLRATELERAAVERGVVTRRDARRIIADRAEIGTSSPLDLARADTELATAEAELAAVSQRAATLRHAFAVLLGSESDLNLNSSL
jgi:outer membrane protein TolC